MGQTFRLGMVAMLAGTFALESTHAGERKSRVTREAAIATADTPRVASAAVCQTDLVGTSGTRSSQRPRAGIGEQAGGRESDTAPNGKYKPITFYRFNSARGEILLQPVFGGVNGAQLSLDF